MKIIPYNRTQNIAFGYDKELNIELKEKLKNIEDRRWAKTISSLNSLCNNLEDTLIREDKSTKKSPNNGDYVDLFLVNKERLAGMVIITFPELRFADREYKHYNDEYKNNGLNYFDWRKKVCNHLWDWTSDIEPSGETKKENKSLTSYPGKNSIINPAFEKIQNPFESLTKYSLKQNSQLEEYIPDKTSPKGFDDVAGMDKLKQELKEGIIDYINNPAQAKQDYEDYGKTIPRGMLLYGPPGCGKTYITQAMAAESQLPMYKISIGNLGSHYINLTSKNIQSAFDEAISIAEKTKKPCLLFMDEIDTLGFNRTNRTENEDVKQIGTILQSMDKAKAGDVIIIGATNKYNLIDPAVLRRFDTAVLVNIPDLEARKELVKKQMSQIKKGHNLAQNDSELEEIAKKLNGYSNDSICKISKEAAKNAMKRNRDDVKAMDYYKAIEESTEEKTDLNQFIPKSQRKNSNIGFVSQTKY
ncbi:MAG: ATP-binding protein [Candidatus Gastranaerophilales bacterium]|nr:ATP-binding protein [Candidatus Gastranaerophilales bacterium]